MHALAIASTNCIMSSAIYYLSTSVKAFFYSFLTANARKTLGAIKQKNIFMIKLGCLLLFMISIFSVVNGQNLDSLLRAPQNLELRLSSLQPRINERVELNIEFNHLRANLLKSLKNKFTLYNGMNFSNENFIKINIQPKKIGKDSIGPLQFTFDNTVYSTNKIYYEVVAGLPKTSNGVWVRTFKINDSTLNMVIEQRIPAFAKVKKKGNSTSYATEAESEVTVKFIGKPKGLEYKSSFSNYEYDNYKDENGENVGFFYSYESLIFKIDSSFKGYRLTEKDFENYPKKINKIDQQIEN